MKDQIDLNTLFAQSGEFPFDSESAVCFTGPRPANLPDGGDGNSAAILEIGRRLDRQIRIDIAAGKTVCHPNIDYMDRCVIGTAAQSVEVQKGFGCFEDWGS